MSNTPNPKRWITAVGTLSYPHLAEPFVGKNATPGQKPKYSCAFLMDGNDPEVRASIAKGEAALLTAAEEVFGTKAATMLKTGALKNPFRRDWEAKGYPENTIYFNTRSEYKPQCVYAWPGPDGRPAEIPQEDIKSVLYPGAKVRISVLAYFYDTQGSKGVTFGLGNVQKVADGPRLDNSVSAFDEFTADASLKPADIAALEG